MDHQDGEGKNRILHYCYNLTTENKPEQRPNSSGKGLFGRWTRNSAMFGSDSTLNQTTLYQADDGMKRSRSIPTFGRNILNGSDFKESPDSQTTKNMFSNGEEMAGLSTATNAQSPGKTVDGSRELRSRKCGLGDLTNRGIMSHKLRKKAVCDSSDNLHYQRQFLRVLNKRF